MGSEQLTFLDGPLARRTDPAQSKDAARSILPVLGDLQAELLRAVREHPGRTSTELARLHDYADPRVFNRRATELRRRGLIREVEVRVCSVTGRKASTWEITERNNHA